MPKTWVGTRIVAGKCQRYIEVIILCLKKDL